MSDRDDMTRLRHMLDNARDAVSLALNKSRSDLESEHMLDLSLKHTVMLVGEAANHVSDDTQKQHPEIAWTQIIGMRNRIIHGYDFIDYDILWSTVKDDLPVLIAQLEKFVPPAEPDD
jgi:uncharacterized protein with HEPN domain